MGDRFQPTGFADLGAATYQLHDGTRMLLVESAQSMANRLEQTIIGPDGHLLDDFKGLSYIVAKLNGDSESETNSLVEAHRLNSPFIISDKVFQSKFVEAAGYVKNKPLDWRKIGKALFMYDVNSILHGAFLANLEDGRIKIARAISAFIEARDVREAVSGGVKNSYLDPTGKMRAVEYDKDVYSNVPYQRVEYTAGKITAYLNIDLSLIRSYALGEDAEELLVGLALYKVRAFFDGGMRLRTACDFKLAGEPRVTSPENFILPDREQLLALVRAGIARNKPIFADPPVTQLQVKVKSVKKGADSEEDNLD
jgi:CRISPR-associated protein Csb1